MTSKTLTTDDMSNSYPYRSLFYRLENPYSDTSRGIRIGEHHGYGLKNINRIVQENHGDFYTKKKDGVFTVQVRLNCEN